MRIHRSEGTNLRRRGRGVIALGCAAVFALAATGCDSLLDVENPNNVKQEDLETPDASAALANGALGTVTRGVLAMWGPYSTATDEVTWIGSRNGWNSLNTGFVGDAFNEFTDAAFQSISEGRWMADDAIRLIEGFDQADELDDPMHLARAYLAGAVVYITIADQFDDYVFSDRKESGAPVGAGNMSSLYETALDYIGNAIAIVEALEDNDAAAAMRPGLYGLRARVHHAMGVWSKLNGGSVPSGGLADPWVSSSEMVTAAGEVLAEPDIGLTGDWSFELDPDNQDVAIFGEVSLAYNVNQRPELQIGPEFAELSGDQTEVEGISIEDPITGDDDPAVTTIMNEFLGGGSTATYTLVSSREMHLLLAENLLANDDEAGAVTHINHVRDMDGLPAYDPAVHTSITVGEMLMHERKANLFLQGRRLADMYRFGIQDTPWQTESDAVTAPGTFFPITIVECRANTNLGEDYCGG